MYYLPDPCNTYHLAALTQILNWNFSNILYVIRIRPVSWSNYSYSADYGMMKEMTREREKCKSKQRIKGTRNTKAKITAQI